MKTAMKIFSLALMILGLATFAEGQVARQGIVLSGSGRPVAGASIWVCTGNVTVTLTANPPCTPAQNIYTDYAQTHLVTQPLLSDGLGNYLYYTQSGTVTEVVTGPNTLGYSAVLTLAPGNAAVKSAVSDGIQFVSNNGSDSNDGLSWGSAKLTNAAACAALPSGNSSCSAGSGTVFISPGFTGTIILPSTANIQVVHFTGASIGNIALLNLANTWTASQSFFGQDSFGGPYIVIKNLNGGSALFGSSGTTNNSVSLPAINNSIVVAVLPGSVSISSGFGTSPSIVSQNIAVSGPIAFEINVGTGGSATSGVIGTPTAPTGWACSQPNDMNTNIVTRETGFTTNTITFTAASAWSASDKLLVTCWPF